MYVTPWLTMDWMPTHFRIDNAGVTWQMTPTTYTWEHCPLSEDAILDRVEKGDMIEYTQ